MALYIARIELTDAGSENYESLHEAMDSVGFSREFLYPDGSWHQLPTGTYVGVRLDSEIEPIRNSLISIAKRESPGDPLVIVCEIEKWGAYLPNSNS
ncbi:DUF2622 domain-containing protein [Buttiauxella sp. S19-1]|uniref:DUF2622 domain-containing protein n=1 Tax=Buttiauxella sp. S19-1 TaxID=941430 RepID=UPI001EDC856A|nr:DUF2622 domain-containing protein [Buttiauxella sp. S19-1]